MDYLEWPSVGGARFFPLWLEASQIKRQPLRLRTNLATPQSNRSEKRNQQHLCAWRPIKMDMKVRRVFMCANRFLRSNESHKSQTISIAIVWTLNGWRRAFEVCASKQHDGICYDMPSFCRRRSNDETYWYGSELVRRQSATGNWTFSCSSTTHIVPICEAASSLNLISFSCRWVLRANHESINNIRLVNISTPRKISQWRAPTRKHGNIIKSPLCVAYTLT